MPKFRFQLEPVLDMRKRAEQDHQLRVAALERERLAIEDKLRACQQSLITARLDMRSRLGGSGTPGADSPGGRVNVQELRMQATSSLHTAAQAQRIAIELAGAYKRLELARAELLKAATARKAVELLREKRYQEWRQEQEKKDTLRVDEAATQQFLRQSATAALAHTGR